MTNQMPDVFERVVKENHLGYSMLKLPGGRYQSPDTCHLFKGFELGFREAVEIASDLNESA